MRAKELRALNKADLDSKLLEMRKELMKMNSQVAVGTVPKQASRIKQIKRTIAQIHTINSDKTLGGTKKE